MVPTLSVLLSLLIPISECAATNRLSNAVAIEISASAETAKVTSGDVAAYEEFCRKHGRTWRADTREYNKRLALFAQRRKAVMEHNAKPHLTWSTAINKFSDITPEEWQAMMGYKRTSKDIYQPAMMRSASFVQDSVNISGKSGKDWTNLASSSFFRNQGACGSCWAVAAVGALEMHKELNDKSKGIASSPEKLSFKHLLDCTPNPQHCGGDGGCSGATAELGFEYVKSKGIATEAEYHDGDQDGACKHGDLKSESLLHITRYEPLEVNKLSPLLDAIHNTGPVVVSVDANEWLSYNNGVFSGCDKDATVNHAVLLVAYGTDDHLGHWWMIRNSWGADWGDKGYMRIKRHTEENQHCGIDNKPLEGVGCKYPTPSPPLKVCGMCGILSDSSYPVF
mmetsp:Transcript_106959/g.190168  ORF Transcript_106959/g.190168 Transcript_106959/m.190168 type:complete len:395 (-) Transcript_106959:58-1242(-)